MWVVQDVIDVEEYANVEAFIKRFNIKINDYVDYKLISKQLLPTYHGMQFDKYIVLMSIFDKQFKLSIITSPNESENFTRKLTIEVVNNVIGTEELRSCINYLQRKRDITYASKQLLEYCKLEKQRNELGKYLLRELGHCLTISYEPNVGYHLKCHNQAVTILYFDSKWKIWWNCRNFTFFDFIDFNVDTETQFYTDVHSTMRSLTRPSRDFEVKRMHWSKLIECVEKATKCKVMLPINPNNKCSKESISTPIIQIDIDSDDGNDIEDITGSDLK